MRPEQASPGERAPTVLSWSFFLEQGRAQLWLGPYWQSPRCANQETPVVACLLGPARAHSVACAPEDYQALSSDVTTRFKLPFHLHTGPQSPGVQGLAPRKALIAAAAWSRAVRSPSLTGGGVVKSVTKPASAAELTPKQSKSTRKERQPGPPPATRPQAVPNTLVVLYVWL